MSVFDGVIACARFWAVALFGVVAEHFLTVALVHDVFLTTPMLRVESSPPVAWFCSEKLCAGAQTCWHVMVALFKDLRRYTNIYRNVIA